MIESDAERLIRRRSPEVADALRDVMSLAYQPSLRGDPQVIDLTTASSMHAGPTPRRWWHRMWRLFVREGRVEK